MSTDSLVPETRVLAIASHVTYGYVGNTMATFVMQSLGCDVAAINTVNFSNHTGYTHVKGTKSTAQEISALYEGLKLNYLTDFDVLLSGYAPSAAAVEAVGEIALDLRRGSRDKPGSFFWVLDPVMGDQGQIYVNEDVVPAYKKLIPHADLILPNQFEAELLSGIKITSLSTLADAITTLHRTYNVPHIIVTSVHFPTSSSSDSSAISCPTKAESGTINQDSPRQDTLTIIGSTARSDGSPRLFKIEVPRLDCFFCGTGDMFAAMSVARLREAVFVADADAEADAKAGGSTNPASRTTTASTSSSNLEQPAAPPQLRSASSPPSFPLLRNTPSWQSPDFVPANQLPLAQSTVKVLASMHCILEKTMEARSAELARYPSDDDEVTRLQDAVEFAGLSEAERREAREKRAYLRQTKAAEIQLVRNAELLKKPRGVEFVAEEWKV
ncbi:pyridoxal kinase [Blastomyces dermatitidis ATCC 18188]|uniref:pyridoxal kinase n=1 Tax=Ajellomyces dermatitidis (strain ATCC 18188 / CBS 674.68) TaxID=653446 RepID=F2TNA9_AJEDA|nr:pyridoxal kinase [Blastomyces dermatitidis ATCC 18188]